MKFDNAVIYRIVCNDITIEDCYVGSTTNFIKRKCTHKYHCTNPKGENHNLHVYKFIRNNGGWDNWKMIEICKASGCTTKQELCKLEREHIEQLKSTLNKIIPTRTSKEYHEVNKEYFKQYLKDYCEKNEERQKTFHKQYYEQNKEHINARRRELRKLKQAKTTTESNEDGVQQI